LTSNKRRIRSTLTSVSLARRNDAGIGDDNAERPQRLGRRVEHSEHIGFDRDVAFKRDVPAAAFGDRLDDGVGRFRVPLSLDRSPWTGSGSR
jgi:hypothetical protein